MKTISLNRYFVKIISIILILLSLLFLQVPNRSFAQTSSSAVTWTNLINAVATGNSIAQSGAGYFAKGQTAETLADTGYFEFTFDGQPAIVGLGNNNDEANNGDYNDLNFAFNFGSSNAFSLRRDGTYLNEGTAVAGDVFRIGIMANGNVSFKKNGNDICDGSSCNYSGLPNQYPYYLVFKTSAYTGQISNGMVSGGSGSGSLTTPTNLQAANGSGNIINLNWDYAGSASGFKIERKLGTGGTYTEIDTVGGSSRSYSDASSKPSNRPFIYRIRAFNGSSNSNYSNETGAVTPYVGNASISTNRDAAFPYAIVPPLPLAGQKFIDESFGTEIMRLTDEADGAAVAATGSNPDYPASFSTAYAIWSSFNSDNTRLFFISPSGSGAFFLKFDPVNFRRTSDLIPFPPTPDGYLVQEGLIWSRFNPNVFYSVVGKKLYQGTVNDPTTQGGQTTFTYNVLRDFSNEIGNDPVRDSYFFKLSLSDDTDDVFWLQVRSSEPYFGERARLGSLIMVWKKSTNTILYRRDFCTSTTSNCTSENKGSIIDKSGRILLALNQSYPDANTINVNDPEIIDLFNGNSSSSISNQPPYYQPGHQDLGRGKSVGGSGYYENKIRKWDLVDIPHIGIELLSYRDWSQDSHFSMLAQDDGWVLVSPYIGVPDYSNENEPIKDEIIQVKTDGSGKVRRLLHHYTKAYSVNGDNCYVTGYPPQVQHTCYYASPRANISRDGKYIAFSSNWGNRNGRVDIFVAKINPAPRIPFSDFDGDDKVDLTVWRPSDGAWYSSKSSGGSQTIQLGSSGDKPVPGDYDGDTKTDVAVWRSGNATWYIQKSSGGSYQSTVFGLSADIPVPGDYDGDGKTDIAVWRPSNGYWYILNSSDGNVQSIQFGTNGDIPIQGNFDGDTKQDLAVFRPSSGSWYILKSFDGNTIGTTFGQSGDIPVSSDYDGDKKTDIAVWRPSNATWYLLQSTKGFQANQFGLTTDIPTPLDYDGDTLTDIAVYRNGIWYVLNSSSGSLSAANWGLSGDFPISDAANSR